MADIICIIGNKGGTGKTTLSHMLCQGMGLLGQRSVCVLTDTYREPLSPEGRRYLLADARTREALCKVTDKIRSLDAWMGVIDGGGNRTDMDRKLYGLADLVLLPFRDSHEALQRPHSDADQRLQRHQAAAEARHRQGHSAATGRGLLQCRPSGARPAADPDSGRRANAARGPARSAAAGSACTASAGGHGLMSSGLPPPPDPFEAIKALWGSMGFAMPGMVTPTLDSTELDKRIADLKAVEGWLQLNLGILQTTLQGLEMQRATLTAMQAATSAHPQPEQDKK